MRFRPTLSPVGAILIGSVLIGLAILAQPFLRRYELRIDEGDVIRINRITGEVVVCSGPGECVTYLGPGTH